MSRPLLAGLVDDAALFPPGNAPMPAAVEAHRAHRRSPHADLVGPFLCPVGRVDELRAELGPGDRLAVGLIVPADLAGLAEALAVVDADERLHLDRIEVPVGPGGVAETAAALGPLLPPAVPAWIELPWTGPGLAAVDALRAPADRPLFAKFRTGGAVVPPVDALAERIVACHAGAPLRFKCTAGLHAAIRHDGGHGFLNVIAASGTAAGGGDPAEVRALVGERDPAVVVAALRRAGSRGAFASFGSCSIDEPLADLAALGLLGDGA